MWIKVTYFVFLSMSSIPEIKTEIYYKKPTFLATIDSCNNKRNIKNTRNRKVKQLKGSRPLFS